MLYGRRVTVLKLDLGDNICISPSTSLFQGSVVSHQLYTIYEKIYGSTQVYFGCDKWHAIYHLGESDSIYRDIIEQYLTHRNPGTRQWL